MKHVLFLMSDTGGGHRAAATAIAAALGERYPGEFATEMVDVWRDYTPFPLSAVPDMYGPWVNINPSSYSALFWLNDKFIAPRGKTRMNFEPLYPVMSKLYSEHHADIVVCVHSIFVRPGMYAMRRRKHRKPFVTVITDYAWPTVLWYDPHVDRCLVPTPPAYERGLTLGLKAEQMRLTGAPVHPKFGRVGLTRSEAKRKLGWDSSLPAVMLIGGGDGMGPLIETAYAIDAQRIPGQLIIIAGRNEPLREKLVATQWQGVTRVYGFVNNMELIMTACDMLVTKAGPGTITEAATVGLPLILSGAIRFQESPNTEYVVQQGAGVYAPGAQRVAETVADLVYNPDKLATLAKGVRKLARPEAIWRIADEIKATVC